MKLVKSGFNIFVKRKYDGKEQPPKSSTTTTTPAIIASDESASVSTTVSSVGVTKSDECQVRDLGDGAILRYYPNFLTFEEQKKLYEHLLSDISVQWTQGQYKGYPLPRMLWSMRSPDLKLVDNPVDEKVHAIVDASEQSTTLKPTASTDSVDSSSLSDLKSSLSSPIVPKVKLVFDTSYQKYTGTGSSVWTLLMEQLKSRIEKQFATKINYCQLNYYRDGQDSISWHSDHELLPGDCIYSVSLYLEPTIKREFLLWAKSAGFPLYKSKADALATDSKQSKNNKSKGKSKVVLNERGKLVLTPTALEEFVKQVVSYWLTAGSLLVMNYDAANDKYWHSLPKDDDVKDGRINITFRWT